MRKTRTLTYIATVMMGFGLLAGGHTAAFADDSSGGSDTSTVGGVTYGPEDGTSVITETFPIEEGSGAVVGNDYATDSDPNGPHTNDAWGSSYAYSEELMYYTYHGWAKAAANVYSNQRIIKVCFWWTRAGQYVSDTTCSEASSNGGGWTSGPEVSADTWDSLGVSDPQTIFNIQTTRIDPNIY